jgi:vacuolar-type H+-ATPase subunit E/Vma4
MEAAAADEEARLLETARAQAEALLAAAREDAAATRERARREAVVAAQATRARLTTEARLEAAARRAGARDALLRRAFAEAQAALAGARERSDYPEVLQALLEEALSELPQDQPLVVRCDPRDVPLLGPLVGTTDRRLALAGSVACWGGVVVQDATGRLVADNTLERRLERAREALWPQVAALVLAPPSPEAPSGAPANGKDPVGDAAGRLRPSAGQPSSETPGRV